MASVTIQASWSGASYHAIELNVGQGTRGHKVRVLQPSARFVVRGDGSEAKPAELQSGEELRLSNGAIGKVLNLAPWFPKDSKARESGARVVAISQREVGRLWTVEVQGAPIDTTPDHPFRTVDRGWIPAEQLRVGDRLASLEPSGEVGVTASYGREVSPTWVYNYVVARTHTYAVGRYGAVVHNGGECTPLVRFGAGGAPATAAAPSKKEFERLWDLATAQTKLRETEAAVAGRRDAKAVEGLRKRVRMSGEGILERSAQRSDPEELARHRDRLARTQARVDRLQANPQRTPEEQWELDSLTQQKLPQIRSEIEETIATLPLSHLQERVTAVEKRIRELETFPQPTAAQTRELEQLRTQKLPEVRGDLERGTLRDESQRAASELAALDKQVRIAERKGIDVEHRKRLLDLQKQAEETIESKVRLRERIFQKAQEKGRTEELEAALAAAPRKEGLVWLKAKELEAKAAGDRRAEQNYKAAAMVKQAEIDATQARRNLSEAHGEISLTRYMEDAHPSAQLAIGYQAGRGFDQVYVKRNADGKITEYILGEAKGPNAPLRDTKDGVTQMSEQWVWNKAMELQRKPESNALGQALERALRTGKPPVHGYIVSTQKPANDNAIDPRQYEVRDLGTFRRPPATPPPQRLVSSQDSGRMSTSP